MKRNINAVELNRHLRAIFMVSESGDSEIPYADDNGQIAERGTADEFEDRWQQGVASLQTLSQEVFARDALRPSSKNGHDNATDLLHRALGGVRGQALFPIPERPRSGAMRAVKEFASNLTPRIAKSGAQEVETASSSAPAQTPVPLRLGKQQVQQARQMYRYFYEASAKVGRGWSGRQLRNALRNLEVVLLQANNMDPDDANAQMALRSHLSLNERRLPSGRDWNDAAPDSTAPLDAPPDTQAPVNPLHSEDAQLRAATAASMQTFEMETRVRAYRDSESRPHQAGTNVAAVPPIEPSLEIVEAPLVEGIAEVEPAVSVGAPIWAPPPGPNIVAVPVATPARSVSASMAQPVQAPTAVPPVSPVLRPGNISISNAAEVSAEDAAALMRSISVPRDLWTAYAAQTAWRLDSHLGSVPEVELDAPGVTQGVRAQAVKMMTPKEWVETEVDIQAVANALQVRIFQRQGATVHTFTPAGAAPLRDVNAVLSGGHYTARIAENGSTQLIDAFSAGDCFYGSVAAAANYRRLREVVAAHQAGDVRVMQAIFAQEYPGQPVRRTSDDLFHGYSDLVIAEVRQRSAAALVANSLRSSGAQAQEDAMIALALSAGDVGDLTNKQKSAVDQAKIWRNQGVATAAFIQALNALQYSIRLIRAFYSSANPDAYELRRRNELSADCRAMREVLTAVAGDVKPEKRREVLAEQWEGIEPVPEFLTQLVACAD